MIRGKARKANVVVSLQIEAGMKVLENEMLHAMKANDEATWTEKERRLRNARKVLSVLRTLDSLRNDIERVGREALEGTSDIDVFKGVMHQLIWMAANMESNME